jgi:hypothetical protein
MLPTRGSPFARIDIFDVNASSKELQVLLKCIGAEDENDYGTRSRNRPPSESSQFNVLLVVRLP